jgi:hypothetical protein
MDPLDFLNLVAKMRFFQSQFIRCRSTWSLEQAKKFEHEVDSQLESISNQLAINSTHEPELLNKVLITINLTHEKNKL